MFEHPYFDVYRFDTIPLDRDCFLMDEAYIEEYEKSLLSVFSGGDYVRRLDAVTGAKLLTNVALYEEMS